jgi:hypothetical protein
MIVVREFRQITSDTPAQWRGRVADHGSMHIRYSWSVLIVRVSETSSDPWENSRVIFDHELASA